MKMEGNLLKMKSVLNTPVDYYLCFEGQQYYLNDYLGKNVKMQFLNEIHCIHCGRKTSKSFSQGYCYTCFSTLPQTDQGVVRPELNLAHEGISRNMAWSEQNDLIDHYVYLSVTSNVKVGVTRFHQIPTRWIDQGAEYAIKLAKTPYRQLAGLIEVELKNYLNDKTNWRKMLLGKVTEIPDLLALKDECASYLPNVYQEFIADDDEITHIEYPVMEYPVKVNSVDLNKTPGFEAVLIGIKGQYLLFKNGLVFNVRKHNGYKVKINIS